MSDRFDPFCPISGDEATIIGRALDSFLTTECRRHVEQTAMLDNAIASEYAGDEGAKRNFERSKLQGLADLRRIDELRHRYIVNPVGSVELFLGHIKPHTKPEGSDQ